ncbi:MAG: DNA replication/repair protein RecF [Flavobacteriales bacterium]|nr:DNA replication/repair protein RecF [Flavobacteriales bacterium]
MDVQLKRLSLMDFRNHQALDLELGPQVNCFIGPNGTGKTNLLDAVHYLSLCKSYFDATDSNNVRHGQEAFMIKGSVKEDNGEHELLCAVQRGKRKVFQRDRKDYERLADHVGRYPAVIVTPYDGQLVSEGSELRRRFLDGLISQFDREYLEALMRYNRALAQRNVSLKRMVGNGRVDRASLEPWDAQLIEHGTMVHRVRVEFLARAVPSVLKHYQGIGQGPEEVALEYRSALHDASLTSLLDHAWERDRLVGHTTQGVHKDDLVFLIDGHPLKRFGSQGQQKTFLIALKLAQFDLTHERTGRKPILMLDDIFDKIDPMRMRHLLQLLSARQFGQVFITDTDASRIHQALDGSPLDVRFFHLSHDGPIHVETIERAVAG